MAPALATRRLQIRAHDNGIKKTECVDICFFLVSDTLKQTNGKASEWWEHSRGTGSARMGCGETELSSIYQGQEVRAAAHRV